MCRMWCEFRHRRCRWKERERRFLRKSLLLLHTHEYVNMRWNYFRSYECWFSVFLQIWLRTWRWICEFLHTSFSTYAFFTALDKLDLILNFFCCLLLLISSSSSSSLSLRILIKGTSKCHSYLGILLTSLFRHFIFSFVGRWAREKRFRDCGRRIENYFLNSWIHYSVIFSNYFQMLL